MELLKALYAYIRIRESCSLGNDQWCYGTHGWQSRFKVHFFGVCICSGLLSILNLACLPNWIFESALFQCRVAIVSCPHNDCNPWEPRYHQSLLDLVRILLDFLKLSPLISALGLCSFLSFTQCMCCFIGLSPNWRALPTRFSVNLMV